MMDWLIFFLIMLASSATPVPLLAGEAVLIVAGSLENFWVVGLVAGVATTVGELTTYYIGRGSENIGKRWEGKRYRKFKSWFERRGFLTIVIFAFTPLPMDLAGFLAGISKYPVKRFLLATFTGRVPRCVLLAFVGSVGLEALKGILYL